MDRCLLDTSIISEIVQPAHRRSSGVVSHFRQYLRAHGRATFSEMSYYEVLRGLRKKAAQSQEQRFVEFCLHAELLPVSREVFDHAATLWAEGQRQGTIVDDGDLLIASTAIVHRLPLVTANIRHFEWIDGLTLLDWQA